MSGPYVYIRSEPMLWTVGFYRPDGHWEPESDWDTKAAAALRVSYLNGADAGRAALDVALNMGDGTYKP